MCCSATAYRAIRVASGPSAGLGRRVPTFNIGRLRFSCLGAASASYSRSFAAVPSAESAFPVVDCSALLVTLDDFASTAKRTAALSQMRSALETRGFFYAAGVETLPAGYIAEVYDFARKAHALPSSVKASWVRPRGTYSGADVGELELAYEAGTKSSVRSWDYQRIMRSEGAESYQYPGEDLLQPDFASFVDDLYSRQDVLADALFVGVAEMLSLAPDTFSKRRSGDMGTIRLLHYPGLQQEEKADSGISSHTDFEALTFMHQDAAGLQLIDRATGAWIDAPVRPKEFIVILGDVFERFTNGLLRATPHRVVQTPHKRNSIIRFMAMSPETLIEPLPEFVSGDFPARYTPVTMRRHMETIIKELEEGKGSWDTEKNVSLTATRVYE